MTTGAWRDDEGGAVWKQWPGILLNNLLFIFKALLLLKYNDNAK
jgi:hypothetical protein